MKFICHFEIVLETVFFKTNIENFLWIPHYCLKYIKKNNKKKLYNTENLIFIVFLLLYLKGEKS